MQHLVDLITSDRTHNFKVLVQEVWIAEPNLFYLIMISGFSQTQDLVKQITRQRGNYLAITLDNEERGRATPMQLNLHDRT